MRQHFEGALIVENPAEILREEEGAFEVISPFGHVFSVTCRRGSKMQVHEVGAIANWVAPASSCAWRIKRIPAAVGSNANAA